MRISFIAASLAAVALAGCTNTVADSRQATAALRQCFVSIAPVDVPEKAKVLAPCAEKVGPALIATLEKAEPTQPQVDCHADALAGARRAVGAMQDLLKIYRRNGRTRLRAPSPSARNIDRG